MCLVWHNRSCDTAGIEEPAIVLNVSRSSTRQMTSSTAPSAIDASAHANTEYSERIFADTRRGFAKRDLLVLQRGLFEGTVSDCKIGVLNF